jgi:hypothetical protein
VIAASWQTTSSRRWITCARTGSYEVVALIGLLRQAVASASASPSGVAAASPSWKT